MGRVFGRNKTIRDMLSVIIAESSLELVPKEIRAHPSVVSSARRFGKKPSEVLLDNSWHFAAMKGMYNELKRGRPDLVHFAMLEATSIPLYHNGMVQVYVHTINDKVIVVGQDVRLPKSYHRFAGLIEKLFSEKTVSANGKKLLELKEMNLESLIEQINPDNIIGLSSSGARSTYGDVASQLCNNACCIVGGFQKGDYTEHTKEMFDELFCIEDEPLESHVVLSRILYEYEKSIL